MRIWRTILPRFGKGIWWAGVVVVTVPAHELKASLAAAETNVASYLEWFGLGHLVEILPTHADCWLAGVLFLVLLFYLLWVLVIRRSVDAQAIEKNPANGWRVARAMMRARAMSQAKALFMDFEAVDASKKTHELEVLAAYGLRWWRTNTEEGGWELAEMEEQAHLRGLGGREPFLEVYRRLDREFPAPWWTRVWRKDRKHAVSASGASWSFSVSTISQDGVTVTRAPAFWRNPVGWTRRKLTAKRSVNT